MLARAAAPDPVLLESPKDRRVDLLEPDIIPRAGAQGTRRFPPPHEGTGAVFSSAAVPEVPVTIDALPGDARLLAPAVEDVRDLVVVVDQDERKAVPDRELGSDRLPRARSSPLWMRERLRQLLEAMVDPTE